MAVTTMAVVGVAGAVAKGIGGYMGKKSAKAAMASAMAGYESAAAAYMSIPIENPYANAQNAYRGLKNAFAGAQNVYTGAETYFDTADNVYDKAENVYEGKMKNAFEGMENAYEGMKNQYEDMDNPFEDLTVNTQQAEFEAQQNQQMQANIMSQMQGAAGGSGIAALAQQMATQGQLQAQQASASIGAQEAANKRREAEAGMQIGMAKAGEGSRIQMAQRSEKSRLDQQSAQAKMDIQATTLGAEDALQRARLGEESKLQMAALSEKQQLQMAKLGEASRLQIMRMQTEQQNETLRAQGEMEVQKLRGQGAMWETESKLGRASSIMQGHMQMYQVAAGQASAANAQMWGAVGDLTSGIASGLVAGSDVRLKENIEKVGSSKSGIPIYTFKYKGDNTLWSGTTAQDLIALGRKDAVTVMNNGYYGVYYDMIDINMKKIK